MTKNTTRKALLTSVLSLMLCFSMLIGTTFAWFTDTVTSAGNIIKTGKLDVEMHWAEGSEAVPTADAGWTDASSGAIFDYDNWEPGYVQVRHIRIANKGTLAFKYNVSIIANGIVSDLAKVIDVYYIDPAKQIEERADLTDMPRLGTLTEVLAKLGETGNGILEKDESDVITIAFKMQETAGNEYQEKSIGSDFSVQLFATQLTFEGDSFDDQYDVDAPVATYKVNPSNVQDYLDGKYGSTTNMKLVLEAGDYGVLYLGRPTKYAGSNTTYVCGQGTLHTGSFETTDAETFKAHLADNKWHTTPQYTTTVENLMIVGEDGAKVAGLIHSTGHSYGDVYDYVRDIDYDAGSAYYSTSYISDVTIENVAFTGKIDINTSDANTVIDGITFRDCSFTTGGTASANGAAIRYYNEANNGKVKNLTVENCEFNSCYQGIYTGHINGISVLGNTFDTLGHNAIALQGGGPVNFKTVVIKNNVMKNVADRVIRFNEVGADSQITIQYNAAVNSGNSAGEVIKATSIANGATFDVQYNDWGGKTVANDELKDKANTEATYADDNTGLNAALTSGAGTIILGSGEYIVPDSASGKTLTLVGNGETKITAQNDGASEGNGDYSFHSSTVTFENITLTSTGTYHPGYPYMIGTFNNCTLNGVWSLYRSATFNDCTFNVSGDLYNVWTWGAEAATFNNCTFNNDGKALLLYGTANTKLTVNGCTFNDNGGLADLKAAIEIGNDYGKSYELIVNDTVVNGYEINDKGINTGSTLWANKNSMGTDKLNVVVDGVDVY
ncbi:MAG: hypothetical protein E7619_08030 [Ruminococcaceae bacterium]|nr:hypothetical protein [Oscillospiraceae bacterium]